MAGESNLESRLCSYAENRGVYVRKFTSHNAGVPDRIFTRELTLFLEIKDLGKKPSALQQDEISVICGVGGYASWVDNYQDGFQIIDTITANRGDWLRKECKRHNYWI